MRGYPKTMVIMVSSYFIRKRYMEVDLFIEIDKFV